MRPNIIVTLYGYSVAALTAVIDSTEAPIGHGGLEQGGSILDKHERPSICKYTSVNQSLLNQVPMTYLVTDKEFECARKACVGIGLI